MENIVLLGATGSIGSSVLSVISHYPERFRLMGVSAGRNLKKLEKILGDFPSVRAVCLMEDRPDLSRKFPDRQFLFGDSGLDDLAAWPDAATTVIAVSGVAGLRPTISAIRGGKRLLSANKESIVAAGDLINSLLGGTGGRIIPLDSEHNAIFNILEKFPGPSVRSVTLTASGGPFRRRRIGPRTTVRDVLAHPTWDMGHLVTVNSATMMNKGFEVIEAHHLFRLEYDRIRVLVHPQSLVHGIVELGDGSHLLFASPSDMRYPIALAMFHPETPAEKFPKLDLKKTPLEFSDPDLKKFPLLSLAYAAGRSGGMLPCILNAANETAVHEFLSGRLPFIRLPGAVEQTVELLSGRPDSLKTPDGLESVLEFDALARRAVLERIRESA